MMEIPETTDEEDDDDENDEESEPAAESTDYGQMTKCAMGVVHNLYQRTNDRDATIDAVINACVKEGFATIRAINEPKEHASFRKWADGLIAGYLEALDKLTR